MKAVKRLLPFILAAAFAWSCQEENEPGDPGNTRDNYLGVWEVAENTGFNAPQYYTVEIVAGSADNRIVIEGLYNIADTRVEALIDGTQISIPNQTTDGITFVGEGNANSDYDQISLSFTANDGTAPDNVEAILIP